MNTHSYKKDFPIFTHLPGLIYLDSTATSLKPHQVIDKVNEYYTRYSANVHRGIYKIAEEATAEYESTRTIIADFIHASRSEEVIYTRGTTESLNLIAYSLGRQLVQKGDEVVTTIMEHHSNFVPWQQLAFENGADFKVIHITSDGKLDIDLNNIEKIITKRTKLVALTYVSNVLGTINPIKSLIKAIKTIQKDCIVVVDAAQAVPHFNIDVQDIGCDFLAFSSHKMFGPTGVGVLWGKYELLERMYPFQFGGEMISEVSVGETGFKAPPYKFEAGTPHIAGAVALKEAVKYIKSIGYDTFRSHEKELTSYLVSALKTTFKHSIKILGPESIDDRVGIVSFVFGHYHPHDIAQLLDEKGIAVRAGHHCTMPLHTFYNIPASTRASLQIYNEKSDIDNLISGLEYVESVLKK